MSLFTKQNLKAEEHVMKYALIHLGLCKISDEKLEKIRDNGDNQKAIDDFCGDQPLYMFVFAIPSGENVSFYSEAPPLDKIKRKGILILRARSKAECGELTSENIDSEVIFMEINNKILEGLHLVCNDVFMPVLGNPLNMIGWSDLVSKDLMDKFHVFLAYTCVTLGHAKGRTILPPPPTDVTSSEKTSSKDKSQLLEQAIVHWTKQIKTVLRLDPETALKNGNDPGPATEVAFWKGKSENLELICEQLNLENIKKVLKFLEQNKSTYTGPFSKLQKEVQTASSEARQNYTYLSTLEGLFSELGGGSKEPSEIAELFIPIMHTILLIWTYSQHYNTPSRLVVLIREICNELIRNCQTYIPGEEVFGNIEGDDVQAAHNKLTIALEVVIKFKEAYFEYKTKAKQQWKITSNALFVRLDSFAERCQDIMHLTSTIIQFNKLEKIQMGNTNGGSLTKTIETIHAQFKEAQKEFTAVKYDIMDIRQGQFEDDFYKFRQRIKELERRLASILTQGFDDCDTIIGKFKLLESFEGLLNRPIIQDELEKKHITLLELYKQDLKTVGAIFMEGKALVDRADTLAPIASNLPPIAGALNWTSGLLERIKEPMDKLLLHSQSVRDREEYKDVRKLYASLCKNLREYDDQKIAEWEAGVEAHTEDQLNKCLLYREETELAVEGFVRVNFDPVLVKLLREVKYLQLLDITVPDRACQLYKKVNVYRTQTGNLEIIVTMYNEILARLLSVEKPLLADRIERMNNALQPGVVTLRWNSQKIDEFIKNAMEIVTDVDELVKKMKDNVGKMQALMAKWEKPLFERKMKPLAPEDLEQTHQSLVMPRLEDVRNHGKEIHKLMKDTADHIKPDKKSHTWLSYVDYVNGLVIEGVTTGIGASMSHLADQISIPFNRQRNYPPMFDIKVDLRDREVVFDPSVGSNPKGSGIRDILQNIIDDFVSLAIQMPRLDTNGGDYLVEIKDQFQLFGAMQLLAQHFGDIETATGEFLQQYKDKEFLWKETLAESFQAFLDAGADPREQRHTKLNDDGEEEEDETFGWMAAKILDGVKTRRPNLEAFDEKITFLTAIRDDIAEAALRPTVDIGWLKVNATPLIKELEKTAGEWIAAYTGFLLDNTTREIQNIENFIKEVETGILDPPKSARSEADKARLKKVMTHLRDVKMIKDRTLQEIAPMRAAVMLLKKHQQSMAKDAKMMDEDFLVKLENSKTALIEVGEKALGPTKEAILPLQTETAKELKGDLVKFQVKVGEYRQDFQKVCPYAVQQSSTEIIAGAYGAISEYFVKTNDLELDAAELNNQETLFDMQKSSYKQLKECSTELKYLKQMWDLISLIDYQFDAWKSTLWDKIDTEDLMVQIREMQTKQCNASAPQNKEIKSWRAFTALNERVKNMNIILPLISQLHSKFMMERHWKKLAVLVEQKIEFNSPKFCLEDLIKLQLHKYAEEVSELVEGAQKEAKIEVKLNNIQACWEAQIFEFKDYKEIPILGSVEETVEFNEQHSMELMGMLSSKDVDEFKDRVLLWQKNLKTVDSVIFIWIKVQRAWQRLEPIFLSAEDIRAQLPDDTRRFESVDAAFKEMMREAKEDPGVIVACTWEGREELLKGFLAEIEICQKALAEYLGQKRKIFPRFYFVAEQALLDILSNGNNPEKVDEYLGDCFDGLKGLDFITDGAPGPRKSSKGMYSKEDEYVPFSTPFTCTGAVENYLCDLEKKMRSELGIILEQAWETACSWGIERDRHVWLEDYCAQVALLGTQIIWTEETARAFDELEGGRETAMSEHATIIVNRIANLVDRVRQDLADDLRTKVITIITIDVHGRDVVRDFVTRKIQDQSLFAWQSQLKFYLEKKGPKDDRKAAVARICDWTTYYNYEYVGNCGRLVITPLTDRCYITLTQALNLSMGGAPAGPAGTGKTETTKDLGRALGLAVVVFNCSPQMTYLSMAQIFMGLAQTGSWGCFDEFNRILIEVLSVVSTQVKAVLDAIRDLKRNPAKSSFIFQEEEISLRLTVGLFITMNPGYAGRTELPENLKALFRSCAMVVPDIVRICENMLMAEGFNTAQALSKKFMTLYDLAKSLLSFQIHYDWGLRAVKSVLRQAGVLKRAPANAEHSEDLLLRRGLKDFNWPKIVVEDRKIFSGLIRDLFPAIAEEEAQLDAALIDRIRAVAKATGLQAEEGSDFALKAHQLADILSVRHSCFIIGNPGTGKTAVWKTLAGAETLRGVDTICETADPKAVTADELFGCMNAKTREWKDGVLSTVMRDMAKNQGRFKAEHKGKWLVLDGDVDPDWIESLNTVMDDNKVLTLVSQERIPLTPEMRLILEVSHLKNATPATVSRGGVLFVNDADVGWRPFFDSWLAKYKANNDSYAENVFTLALSHYISDAFLDDLRTKTHIAPVCDMSQVSTLTCIIDFLYGQLHKVKAQHDLLKRLRDEGKEDDIKQLYEAFFVFAAMWAYGGSLDEDNKGNFSKYFLSASKVKFPEGGQCFDYFFDPLEGGWRHWDTRVAEFDKSYDGLFANLVVPTAETTRQRFLLDLHVAAGKGVLYVGSAGTGKTTIIQDYFSTLDPEATLTQAISFNSFTDSGALQLVLESQVDKRAGRTFGPPPSKTLIYFMDDLNMPAVDRYGTQSPICLVRQIIDHGIVYDRAHLEEQKLLVDIMFTACMNPKSGSFTVDLRLTRQFTLISCLTTEKEILKTIYFQILDNHLCTFEPSVAELSSRLVAATTTVFWGLATSPQFMPTARKFHYQFNLRDFSSIIQGLTLAQPNHYRGNPLGVIRMWAHECNRVWADRLLFEEDREAYMNYMRAAIKEFGAVAEEAIFEDTAENPLLYTSYVAQCEGHEGAFLQVKSMVHLKGVLDGKLAEYNDQIARMDLVLFDVAMCHISRIARIVDLPAGNALLVGVGGSGKQSLAKLSAFLLSYDIFRIVVTTSYNTADLRTDIQTMFLKAGVSGAQLLFLLTDGQITSDQFLVPINDLLSSGWVPELFPAEELDGILGKVRGEAKAAGYLDTPDQLFEFFLNKVQSNLHLGLCFSPVGDAFRFRARMFPGVINCTSLDWFHEWPREALLDVSSRFLADIELPEEGLAEKIGEHMAFVHLSIADANVDYLQAERRHNYTTPTSFLELINFYKDLLAKKRDKISEQIERFENGLAIMKSTTDSVSNLQALLKVKMVDVEYEKEKTGELIEIVGRESVDAGVEQDAAGIQRAETTDATNAAKAEKASADAELADAVPAMLLAEAAVDNLDKGSVQELKSLQVPPEKLIDVTKAVLILKYGEKKKHAWVDGQKMMKDPVKFIQELKDFDMKDIDEWKLDALVPILALPHFNSTDMKITSVPAGNICEWVINVVRFNVIYKKVKPLQDAAAAAQATADAKTAELAVVEEKLRVINEKVDELKRQLYEAEAKKKGVEDEAGALQDQLALANRLVGGLADENKRWAENVVTFKGDRVTMIGDALVSAAFVSYIGPFSAAFRAGLWRESWLPDLAARAIPATPGVDPLAVLATAADQAVWKAEGLPADRVSLENAAVVVSCNRYPLLIDPQLQGQKWVKGREKKDDGQPDMITIQLSQKNWLKKVEMAVSNGNVLMIEAIGQDIDAILDPLLSRQFVKKGRNFTVRLGAEDVDISKSFKLYLQTKLINPHYKPETAAQCTIINFIVTESGLEDQLLAMVVKFEKPELESQKEELVEKQNEYLITLAGLESALLQNLTDADAATILQNTALIESLEVTKQTSTEIKRQQAIALTTEVTINKLREGYRRVAAEGAMQYFLLIQLCIVNHMYQYSLESFTTFFFRAIDKTALFEEEEPRVLALRDVIRMTIYRWVARGLFEKHKQIFRCQLTFRLMQKKILHVDYTEKEMHFLLNCPGSTLVPNPLKDWLPDLAWASMQKLVEIEGFELLAQHVEKEAPGRFKDWYNELAPEEERLPLDWKKLEQTPYQKLLVVRVLRPDRITTALDNFVRRTLPKGGDFVEMDSSLSFQQVLQSAHGESSPTTPIYFILSPGADPVKDVETLARSQGMDPSKTLHSVALGQGQDVVALSKLDIAHKEGHWVMLQNVHLMPSFLIELEKKLDIFALEGSNPSFRLYVSSSPSNDIPIGLLERCIKLTNEPPEGLKQNMKRAFTFFDKNEIEEKDPKIKSILFALCYFHSVMLERRKFGPKGWNMRYPFSVGDLRDSAIVLNNYMETNAASGKIPWDDLKYIFGDIMYGGHIVDDRDRIFCSAYLDNLMNDGLLEDDEAELFPFVEGKAVSFKCPAPTTHEKYLEHIETECPPETPLAFGMDPNAEIDFRTQQCTELFATLQDIQPRDASSGSGGGQSLQETIQAFMLRVSDEAQLDALRINIEDIQSKLGDEARTPYQSSFLQECVLMNTLIRVILTSLGQIELAFKGELTMTEQMETLMNSIAMNRVPATWEKYGFATTRALASWLENLRHRLDQLNIWKEDPVKEKGKLQVTFVNRLFNPNSFLTSIKQVYAREHGYELNTLTILTSVTKLMYYQGEALPPASPNMALVFGFQVEGCRWDAAAGQLDESRPKKPFSVMPVVICQAAREEEKPNKTDYLCPCYRTTARGATYVFTAQLKTKAPPQRWILAGVALILDVEGVSDGFAPGKEAALPA